MKVKRNNIVERIESESLFPVSIIENVSGSAKIILHGPLGDYEVKFKKVEVAVGFLSIGMIEVERDLDSILEQVREYDAECVKYLIDEWNNK